MERRQFAPIYPGEVLLHDFMEPMGATQYRVAKEIDVPARRINEIVHGLRGIGADSALRLARYFGLSDQYWLNLQTRYDLQTAKEQMHETLDAIMPIGAWFRIARSKRRNASHLFVCGIAARGSRQNAADGLGEAWSMLMEA